MNPSLPTSDTGATEFLANLSVGTVVLIALILTVIRLVLLRPNAPLRPGKPPEVPPTARGIAEILESLIIAGVLVFLIIRPFFVQAFFIPSESMEPTLLGHNAGVNPETNSNHSDTVHDHIFVNKLIYRYSEPQRGDVIVFKAPKEADAISLSRGLPPQENVLIKRLIGIPGDTIQVKDGAVYRNGQKLNEPVHVDGKEPLGTYEIREPISDPQPPNAIYGTDKPIKLGPNQLFVMGDNRNDSNDSRYWGVLDRSRVIGKASLIFWPLNRLRVLH
jgi:signal peptidase I